jgi:hypothetical protein
MSWLLEAFCGIGFHAHNEERTFTTDHGNDQFESQGLTSMCLQCLSRVCELGIEFKSFCCLSAWSHLLPSEAVR